MLRLQRMKGSGPLLEPDIGASWASRDILEKRKRVHALRIDVHVPYRNGTPTKPKIAAAMRVRARPTSQSAAHPRGVFVIAGPRAVSLYVVVS